MSLLLATIEATGGVSGLAIPPGGLLSVTAPLEDSPNLGVISRVVFGADAYTTVTGGASIGERRITWTVGADSAWANVGISPGPPEQTVRTVEQPLQPNGEPWTWAAINQLVHAVTADCIIAPGDSATLTVVRHFAEIYGEDVENVDDRRMSGTIDRVGEGVVGPLEMAGVVDGSGEGRLEEPAVASGAIGVRAEGTLRSA